MGQKGLNPASTSNCVNKLMYSLSGLCSFRPGETPKNQLFKKKKMICRNSLIGRETSNQESYQGFIYFCWLMNKNIFTR